MSCSQSKYLIKVIDEDNMSIHSPFGYRSGYISITGDTIIPFDKYARCYTDTFKHYAIVYSKERGLIGINQQEQKLFHAVWNGEGGPIEEQDGMILIQENGQYGFANAQGEIVIAPIYSCAESFYNGKAKVSFKCYRTDEDEHFPWRWVNSFYINKKGERVN